MHLGGTVEEIAEWEASHTGRPFVLLAQHTLFDATRAPTEKHCAWAYCHVANGSQVDMADAIEAQVERFAPGFRQRILRRHIFGPAALESHNLAELQLIAPILENIANDPAILNIACQRARKMLAKSASE